MLMNIGLTGSRDPSSHCDVSYSSHSKLKKLNNNPTMSYNHPGIGWLGESRFEKNTFMTALSQDHVIEALLKEAVVSGSLLLVSVKRKVAGSEKTEKVPLKALEWSRFLQPFFSIWKLPQYLDVNSAFIYGSLFSSYRKWFGSGSRATF